MTPSSWHVLSELGLRSSALLLASFLAFTALPAYASDGTGAAASEASCRHAAHAAQRHLTRLQAIGVLNQVATTLTGLAVAFLGGVAILMRPMQSDISTLKADVGQLKADVGQLKLNLNVSTLLTITGFVSLGVLIFTTSR
jgi:enoyl-[acyl-carrier-protein] reductase (NADH)